MDRCILCLEKIQPDAPPEHIIPQYLGGRLKIKILCKKCNHGIGAKLYSDFKFDTFIRQSGNTLREDIPSIYKTIEDQQAYTSQAPIGTPLKIVRRKDTFNIASGPQSDDSFIVPTVNAKGYINSMLHKQGINETDRQSIIQKVLNIPNKEKYKISPSHSFVRWNLETVSPDYSSNRLVNLKAPLLLAFEFFSLIYKKNIYDSQFNYIRDLIVEDKNDANSVIEELTAVKPKPIHRMYSETAQNCTKIYIYLFDYVVFKVVFRRVQPDEIIESVYLEDLKLKKSFTADSVAKAKENEWYELIA